MSGGTFFWTRTDRGEQEVETFSGQVLRIGRGTNAELRFTEKTIDLEHATIAYVEGGYLLRDLRSSSGVWLNGERVRSARLRDEDAIELGGYRLAVKWPAPADPLFLQIEPLSFDPERSTVIHTFKASNQALVVLAELEAQRLEREPTELSTYIGRVLTPRDGQPGNAAGNPAGNPAGNTVLMTRFLPAAPKPPISEGFTELLAVQRDPQPGAGKTPPLAAPARGGAPPLAMPPPPAPGAPPGLPPLAAQGPPPPPSAPARPPAARPEKTRPAGIDFGRSYLLPELPAKLGVGLVVFLATGLFFFQLFAAQGGQMFAPGPLAAPHRATIKACGDCHSGFRPVSDLSCRSSCHSTIGDHQNAGLAGQGGGRMACTDCHLEHHGDAALKLASANTCASCHDGLAERLPASVFANRITDFESDHPEFAIDTPEGRRRLSDPGGRQSDPGGLVNFDHGWHLTKLPAHLRRDCEDCHRRDPKTDEILALDFEASCQSCHSLPFDPRFPGQQVPHGAPRQVFDYLTGVYLRNPQVLARLDGNERLAASASLSREQQLAKVAQVVGERLLRNSCAKCHRFESAGRRGDEAQVAPVRWRAPYFLHANFRHAPHLRLAECQECHAEARASRKSEDLLLPGIAACQTCHREASSAKVDKAKIGESHCLNCHSYHPTPAELAASRASS